MTDIGTFLAGLAASQLPDADLFGVLAGRCDQTTVAIYLDYVQERYPELGEYVAGVRAMLTHGAES